MFSQACRPLSRDILLAFNGQHRCAIDQRVRDVVSRLRLRRRGCRAGNNHNRRVLAAQSVTSAVSRLCGDGEIPIIVGHRMVRDVNTSQLFHGVHRDARDTAARIIPRHNHNNVIRLGLFNARSVAEKSAAIQQWISDMKLGLVALMETWHDDASSPQLVACVPLASGTWRMRDHCCQ